MTHLRPHHINIVTPEKEPVVPTAVDITSSYMLNPVPITSEFCIPEWVRSPMPRQVAAVAEEGDHAVSTVTTRCVDNPAEIPERDDNQFVMTVVFDLDETLVNAADDEHLVIRPFARNVLDVLTSYTRRSDGSGGRLVEIIVWSAGMRCHVDRCLEILDPDRTLINHAICRGSSWWKHGDGGFSRPVLKDIKLIGGHDFGSRSNSRAATSIIVDDNAFVVLQNVGREIIVPAFRPYVVDASTDTVLFGVLQIITFIVVAMIASSSAAASEETPTTATATTTTAATTANSIIHESIRRVRCVLASLTMTSPPPSPPCVATAAAMTPPSPTPSSSVEYDDDSPLPTVTTTTTIDPSSIAIAKIVYYCLSVATEETVNRLIIPTILHSHPFLVKTPLFPPGSHLHPYFLCVDRGEKITYAKLDCSNTDEVIRRCHAFISNTSPLFS
jgi:hypothetical protein